MTPVAEANHEFTVVLHARTPAGSGSCTEADLPNCRSIRPTTQVEPRTDYRIYMFVNNFDSITGIQTAFDWPRDWILDPDGQPPNAHGCFGEDFNCDRVEFGGTYVCAFDCFQGPGPLVIVRIDFETGPGGCLVQVNPNQGSGRVEIVDCENRSSFIDANDPSGMLRLGSICVGTPGRDACDPLSTPVESQTWGRIKASYR